MKLILTVLLSTFLLAQTEQALNFSNEGLKINGFLTSPLTNGPHPVIILVHGSGGFSARNDSFKKHIKEFNKAGIAVYVYEKRGIGGSEGDFQWAKFSELSSDVLAAAKMLSEKKNFIKGKIGLWGFSQGGWLAPLTAVNSNLFSFVITVSGSSSKPYDQNLYAISGRAKKAGLKKSEVKAAQNLLAVLMDYYAKPNNELHIKAQAVFDKSKSETWFSKISYPELQGVSDKLFPPSVIKQLATRFSGIAFYQNGDNYYDPMETLKKLSIPLLAIYGEADAIVNPQAAKEKIQSVFKGGRSKLLKLNIFPKANHGLNIGKQIPYAANFVDGYFDLIVSWSKTQFKMD